jgi:hydrophobe/amphiphile efflux-1 (HAE1) family protein
MTLSDLSVRRPVFAWMLMIGLMFFGALCFLRLGVSQMPDIDFPVLNINVNWEGAVPEIIETEIVDPIEEKVISVEGLKEIRSNIRPGVANVDLEFEIDRDIDAALQEVQAAISRIRLPLNVEPPVIRKNSPDAEPIMWVAVTGRPGQSMRDLIAYVDTVLLDQMQTVPGVGEVRLGGFAERNMRIWVRNEALKKFELTVLDVVQAIEEEHVELAGGYIENDRNEINVRAMGEGLSVEEVENILITKRGGQPIYESNIRIKDVARVEDGLSEVRRIARANGTQAVNMGISKQRGSNEVLVSQAVKDRIASIQNSLPEGMRLQVIVDFSRFVEQSVHTTQEKLIIAALLTGLICYLFLGNWSAALNVNLAIPTSILGTLILFHFAGFTLNTFTLLALTLAIGIVVDDAIMVLENIDRHFRMGKNRFQAALDGAREITFAAVAATVAVMAIFIPVIFMEDVIGKFFFQFGLALTVAVGLSLLESITLIPMRSSQMMRRNDHPNLLTRTVNSLFQKGAVGYAKMLAVLLAHPWKVIVIATGLFALSLAFFGFLRMELIPPQDQDFIRVGLRTPTGSSLAYTDSKARLVEEYIARQPEVERYFASVGGFDGNPVNFFMPITLKPRADRALDKNEIEAKWRRELRQIPELEDPRIIITFTDNSARGLTARGNTKPVEFNIRGSDFNILSTKSKEIMEKLAAGGLMTDIDSSYREGMPEIRVIPDRKAAADSGVSMDNLGRTINTAIGGLRTGKFSGDGRRYDVRIRLEPEERLQAGDIQNLQVRTIYGELLPISRFIRLEEVKTLQNITRVNRQRAISISANLVEGASQATALNQAAAIAREVLPPGYSFHLEGGSSGFQSAFQGLLLTLLLGVIVAYMVLAAQFNSFLHPLTVMLALPFSLTGALLGLWMTDQSLNLYSAIGIILLMGIAKKNSILLVEFTNQKRHHDGMDVEAALRAACPIRLRPILMTSLATVAAAVPLALPFGAGWETRTPMAVAIIGGIIFSTLCSLVVVPCAYRLLARFERPHPEELLDAAPTPKA